MVELKNGETFNGHLVACDNFMNFTMKEVYQTSADGAHFWKMEEAYVKGQNVSLRPHSARGSAAQPRARRSSTSASPTTSSTRSKSKRPSSAPEAAPGVATPATRGDEGATEGGVAGGAAIEDGAAATEVDEEVREAVALDFRSPRRLAFRPPLDVLDVVPLHCTLRKSTNRCPRT
jgi:U6 snRNA-associated Sm-like protein LSm4